MLLTNYLIYSSCIFEYIYKKYFVQFNISTKGQNFGQCDPGKWDIRSNVSPRSLFLKLNAD